MICVLSTYKSLLHFCLSGTFTYVKGKRNLRKRERTYDFTFVAEEVKSETDEVVVDGVVAELVVDTEDNPTL